LLIGASPALLKADSAGMPQTAVPSSSAAQRRLAAGRQHLKQHRWHDAERALGEAVAVLDGNAFDWLGLAIARQKLGRLDEAQAAARRALDIEPGFLEAREMLGQCLLQLGRPAEAVAAYESAPPDAAFGHDSLLNHGMALVHADRAAEAVPLLLRAIALKMDSVPAYVRLGGAFKRLKMFEEASECFRTAVALDPNHLTAHGFLVHLDQFACRWQHFEADVAAFLAALERTRREMPQGQECTPFALVAIPHDPMTMRHAAQLEAARQAKAVRPLPPARWTRGAGERLRVGYLSADFYQHATAMLIAEVFERHDRARFEVFVYSHGRDDGSPIRRRLQAAVEHWVEVGPLDAEATARRIRADGVDLLVDLKGYTQDHRFQTLACRAAPLQASWLGFPATTGAPWIDYFIGDPWVTPLEHAPRYTEKLAQLPVCYQPNDRQRPLPAPATRAQWGLPEGRPVLASFNNVYKITPACWSRWMRILRAVPEAVLWLLDGNEQAKANLRREAQARGVDPQRLLFAPAVPPAVHQSRLALADLMLDTWPCNAHTTASDALWAGLPLLTLSGEIFASRVAGSLLRAVGLPELVTHDEEAYEATAVALLHEPARLAALRRRLVEGRLEHPLFDSARFTAELEALYLRMAERARAGLAPDHLPA
jgi:predicted O-linked N-acetylglucosamine transferase (SPINDLY family)